MVLQRGEEIGRKKRREANRERNLWEEKRPEGMIEKREKIKEREEMREFIVRKTE